MLCVADGSHVPLVTGAESSLTLRGYRDGAVIIKCNYNSLYKSSRKCFYKGGQKDDGKEKKWCAERGKSGNGKFTLHEDTKGDFFMVLITQLTREDVGQYQCVIDKAIPPAVYTDVRLVMDPGEN